MAPIRSKLQNKKNSHKMKRSKSGRKRRYDSPLASEQNEKPLTGLKWFNKLNSGSSLKSNTSPEWTYSENYKQEATSGASAANTSEYDNYQEDLEEKSISSDASGECNCPHSKYEETNQAGILKNDSSSSNSLVSKYIKLGMNQVASFIVESAIRFGEEHGVVVPDKDTPNLYEITPPDGKLAEKIRKIRFKFPEKHSYDDRKAVSSWRKDDSPTSAKADPSTMVNWNLQSKTSWESSVDSLDDILPILEKLKQGGDIVDSDLDLEKLAETNTDDSTSQSNWERPKDREREKTRYRNKQLLKERLKTLKKRYKSMESTQRSEDDSEVTLWKGRRDSLELGRRRLRSNTCARKEDGQTPSPF